MLFNNTKPSPPKPYLDRWEPYDTIQCFIGNKWEDYSSIRNRSDALYANDMVEARPDFYRIISPARTIVKAGLNAGNEA